MSKPEINVTPLIDVLLVLLIIFMVVTPMKPSAFEAKIPRPPADDLINNDPLTLVVVIEDGSSLRLNHDRLSATISEPGVLVERLRSIFEERTQNLAFAENTEGGPTPRIEKTVFIKAPRGLDYGSVARVIDAVKTAGASPVSLQIDDLD